MMYVARPTCLAVMSMRIQVTDNPYAWVQMSALSAASILATMAWTPVPILSCRDRNRRALHSDLLGLQAIGVSSLMLMRGHRVPKNHSVPAGTVFDLTGRELISPGGLAGGQIFLSALVRGCSGRARAGRQSR